MKFKNYRSAIHNFAHSFQSIDYTHSGKIPLNTLILLNRFEIAPSAIFDFIDKTIKPEEANTKESRKLLNDYLYWLPIHFRNHNCDIEKLEKLVIVISTDFEKAFTPQGMKECSQINIDTTTNWKAADKTEETIEISLDELVHDDFLKSGIPEM